VGDTVALCVGLGSFSGGCDFRGVDTRCVFVGLGSGALPAFVHHHFPAVQCEVVEIDPVVVFAATKFLGFPTRLTTIEKVSSRGPGATASRESQWTHPQDASFLRGSSH